MTFTENEPKFAFEKKIGISDVLYSNPFEICKMIERLLWCMKETNKLHDVKCEFFRLDFRQQYFDESFEFPQGSLILHLRWGSREEIENKDKEK